MASLKPCRDCGHEVSKTAEVCPNCGRRLVQRWYVIRASNLLKGAAWFIVLLIVIAVFSLSQSA